MCVCVCRVEEQGGMGVRLQVGAWEKGSDGHRLTLRQAAEGAAPASHGVPLTCT